MSREPQHVHRWGESGKFVVVIVHGAAEHGGRYAELGRVFTEMGGLVLAPDHEGHGRTAGLRGRELGKTESKDAIEDMAEDVVSLIRKECQGLPWFLVGHSMGTVIAQFVLEKLKDSECGNSCRGLILSGPPMPPSGLEYVAFMGLLKMMVVLKRGQSIVHALTFDKYDKQTRALMKDFALPKNSWLNEEPDAVKEYNEDPLCGQDLDFAVWLSLLMNVEKLKQLTFKFRHPILIVGGDGDPATNFGRNLDLVRDRLKTHVDSPVLEQVLFVGARHELTKGKYKQLLFDKVRNWTLQCLGRPLASLCRLLRSRRKQKIKTSS